MIIINGTRVTDTGKGETGQPIGQLTDPNGNVIELFSKDPVELAAAELLAIGRLPQPMALSGGGSLQVAETDLRTGQPTKYVYNPSPDERDKNEIALYQAKLAEWSTRAATVSKAIDRIVANADKKATKPTTAKKNSSSGRGKKKGKKKIR